MRRRRRQCFFQLLLLLGVHQQCLQQHGVSAAKVLSTEREKKKSITSWPVDPNVPLDWRAGMAAMHEVMANSTRNQGVQDTEFETATLKALGRAVADKKHSVFIVRGQLFVDKEFLGEMKRELHLRYMRSVLSVAQKVAKHIKLSAAPIRGDHRAFIVYTLNEAASGPTGCDPHLPTLAIAKKKGLDEQCGVLIPNPYFGELMSEWEEERTRLARVADNKKWTARNPRVFWRGKIRDDHGTDCSRDAGNQARVSACALTLKHGKFFDVRATSCERRSVSPRCAREFAIDPIEKKAASGACRSVTGQFVGHAKFSDYRFVLDLPGSTTGSYSRNLNHLWLMGAVVLIWTGPFIETSGAAQWYTPALREKHTHVSVDRDSAPEVVAFLSKPENFKYKDYMLANARAVSDKLLCAECQVEYMIRVFDQIDRSFPFLKDFLKDEVGHGDPQQQKKANAESIKRRQKALIAARCDKLNLVRVAAARPPRHKGGNRPSHWQVHTRPLSLTGTSACDLLTYGAFSASRHRTAKRKSNNNRGNG